jgi:hypothetical protein
VRIWEPVQIEMAILDRKSEQLVHYLMDPGRVAVKLQLFLDGRYWIISDVWIGVYVVEHGTLNCISMLTMPW